MVTEILKWLFLTAFLMLIATCVTQAAYPVGEEVGVVLGQHVYRTAHMVAVEVFKGQLMTFMFMTIIYPIWRIEVK